MTERHERTVFLSAAPATAIDRRLALIVLAISCVAFLAAVPFARVKLAPAPAFVAGYQSTLALTDLITAVLLCGQFVILRARQLLILIGGYLFTAVIALAHMLSFPGLFAPTGLLRAGPQTTVWLYMLWHAGFPLLLIGYALFAPLPAQRSHVAGDIAITIVSALAAAAVCVFAVTAGHDFLPLLLVAGSYTSIMIAVVSGVWLLRLAALLVMWFRKPHSVLDLWLMVVMCAWLFDIALSAVLNAERFDLGFYAGRLYGLCAASFVLIVLLCENFASQTQLVQMLGAERGALDQEIEERQRIFETSQDLILVTDTNGTFIQVSPSAMHILGYRPDEMVGRSAIGFVYEDDLGSTRAEMRQARRGRLMRNFETRYVHKSGRIVPLTWMGVWSEPVKRHFFIGRDMTESQLARQALAESARMARGIIDTALDAFVQLDEQGLVTDWNLQAEAIFGWRREEAIGRRLSDMVIPEAHRSRHEEGIKRFLQTGTSEILGRRFEIEAQSRAGKQIKVELSITAFQRDHGTLFNGFIRDLTEKNAAEEQLRQAQKMEAVGQLTGGIAHDFNNILTVITGTIEILEDAVADRPQIAAIARMIDEAAGRGADLTRHLLAFARKQPLQPRETNVNELIVEAAKLLRPTLGEPVEIESMLSEDAWPALVDPNQLTTAVLNLALNARDAMSQSVARDAMSHGGKLTLETRNVHLDDDYAAANRDVTPGAYVMIAVSDTGPGIPAHLLEKVFEPFFTTKEVGKGTGLGLSMVYGFVKQSNGHIKIYSEEGHGTAVKIYLPRAHAAAVAAEPAAPRQMQGGRELVLVVEDDPLVRNYVIAQIRSLGYTTLSARNAAEALAVIDSEPGIELLFTDIIMPGARNGRQLADAAQAKKPDLKVLYTSGYTENAIVHHGRLDSGVLLLAKPYRKADLARMLRRALDGKVLEQA